VASHQAVADSDVLGSKPVKLYTIFTGNFFTFIYMYYGPPILQVFKIMDLNRKRFLAYYGKIILMNLMPEILMGVYHCSTAVATC
jgi:hypothetical protein